MPYIIMTDSHTDLPYTLVDKWDLPLALMPYSLDGEEHFADMGRNKDYVNLFKALASGVKATTSQLPVQSYLDYLEPHLKNGSDVLFIAFSSQLSKTIDNLRAAASELMERYPGRRIEVFDTLAMSMAHGLLVKHAVEMRAEGASMDDVLAWLNANFMCAHGAFV
ncbi:MAG: DegV family protein, partial [Christensenellales bacterium]